MKVITVTLAALACLAACSTQTGIVPAGKGLYTASNMEYSSWSSGSAKVNLMKEAAAFCAKSGKEFVLESSKSNDATFTSYASAEIFFRCE